MIGSEIAQARDAVCSDPSDTHLRMALADAYESAGHPERARFIRLQNERAALPHWDVRTVDLELEERGLLAEWESRWRKSELPKLKGMHWGRFERGLVASAAFDDPTGVAKHGDAVVSAAPIERALMQWPVSGKFAPIPTLGQVQELTLVGTIYSAKDLRTLAKSPLLGSIHRLNIVDASLRTGLGSLLKSPRLEHLEALRIPHHHLGNRGLKPLLDASLPELTELVLPCASHHEEIGSGDRYQAAFNDKVVYALVVWPGLTQLEALDVSGNLIGIDALSALLGSPRTKALRRLSIRRVADGEWDMDDSLVALGYGPAGTLDELDIGDNDLNQDAALALANASALHTLKVLRMDKMRSRHFDVLSSARWIHELRVLQCDAASLPALLKKAPRQLHTLASFSTPDDPLSVIDALESTPTLSALKSLDLRHAALDDDALHRVARLSSFPALAELRLRNDAPKFTQAGVATLASSALGRRLTSLDSGIAEFDRLPRPARATLGHGAYVGPLREL